MTARSRRTDLSADRDGADGTLPMCSADCEDHRKISTDAEWQTCADPASMLFLLGQRKPERSKIGRRKLRLYACALCRLHWSRLSNTSRRAVEITERYADGLADRKEFGLAQRNARYDFSGSPPRTVGEASARYTFDGALNWVTSSAATAAQQTGHHFEVISRRESPVRHARELSQQADLLREVFGSPFCRISLRGDWLTLEVTSLARTIYDRREFGQMPRLADALRDSGCDDNHLLAHFRSGERHVTGCWAVDLLLGRHWHSRAIAEAT